jgi:hypothetical protein
MSNNVSVSVMVALGSLQLYHPPGFFQLAALWPATGDGTARIMGVFGLSAQAVKLKRKRGRTRSNLRLGEVRVRGRLTQVVNGLTRGAPGCGNALGKGTFLFPEHLASSDWAINATIRGISRLVEGSRHRDPYLLFGSLPSETTNPMSSWHSSTRGRGNMVVYKYKTVPPADHCMARCQM